MGLPERPTRLWNLCRPLWALALSGSLGCTGPDGEDPVVEEHTSAISGENQSGSNLAGANLSGSNLSGANLMGWNMGGTNLSGSNLSGSNTAGTNLGGNNLAGSNLSGSNLSGANLSGSNLSGANLSGSNLSGSNLSGSNLSGANTGGNNLSGSNLSGSNLSGSNSGVNIHNLSGATGMLYSREDVWSTKPSQCIVMGIGSTAFAKLLGQQTANARISVALGKLPWGFASSSGGAINLRAWEAVVWGDTSYCVFIMAAPESVGWTGAAGFIKAVFRWNAPPAQSIDISGIDAALAVDATTPNTITTYTGMMNAAAKWRGGTITDQAFLAGELAFATATTNNQSVMVDFSSWVQDKNKNALVLGNVQSTNPPTYAEALYIALDNGDGTVQVIIDDAASRATPGMPSGMTNSVLDLDIAYLGWQAGLGPKPVPRRCGGALFLNAWFGEAVPAGKCDTGLAWAPGFCAVGSDPWSVVSGTTAPLNGYMQLTKGGGLYKRGLVSNGSCGTMKPVLSETYVHMWEPNFDIPAATCTAESDASFCSRRSKNCGTVSGTDNCGKFRTVSSCGTCGSGNSCGGGGVSNVCGNSNTKTYEAEAAGNGLGGTAVNNVCYQAFTKTIVGVDPSQIDGACWAGGRVRFIGNGSSNGVTVNNINVPTSGSYTVTVWAMSKDARYFEISVNGGSAKRLDVQTGAWDNPRPFPITVSLNAGNNSVKFYNSSSAMAPDLDRIVVAPASGGSGGTCAAAYANSACLTYYAGIKVSRNGHNWTCSNGNCMNCATYTSCEPGQTGCPWGAVWTDNGACN
jgi:hypothetical protein